MKRSYSMVVSLALLASCPAFASSSHFGRITSVLHGEFHSPAIGDPITGEIGPYFYDYTFEGAGSKSFGSDGYTSDWPRTSVSTSVVLSSDGYHAQMSVSGTSINLEDRRYGSYSASITFVLLTAAEFSRDVWIEWTTASGGFGKSSVNYSLSMEGSESPLADSLSHSHTLGILYPGTYVLHVDGYSTPDHHGLSGSSSVHVTLDIIPEPATASLFLVTALAALAIRPRRHPANTSP